jgi:hypothetical protein
VDLGVFRSLHLSFDDILRVKQTVVSPNPLPSNKPLVPLCLSSSSDIELSTNLQTLAGVNAEHPLLLIAQKVIRLSSELPLGSYFGATAVALGSQIVGSEEFSVLMDAGGQVLTPAEKQAFLTEIRNSSFVLDATKRDALITALQNDRKVVWFRGTLALRAGIQESADLQELHFESSRYKFSLLPPFPYVQQLESTRKWQ